MVRRAADFTQLVIELEVWDQKHLAQIMSGLQALDVVSEITRLFGADIDKPFKP